MPSLRRNRLLLLASLALLGGAVGVAVTLLSPRGFVRARSVESGARSEASADVVGYGDRASEGPCGLLAGGEAIPLRGCHAYVAPAVLELDGRRFAVWEHDDDQVALSELGPDLGVLRTVFLPRPRDAGGALLPRTAARTAGDRVEVWYHGGRVVTVGADLRAWPGGASEVVGVRLGSGAVVLLLGAIALLAFYLGGAGWTFDLAGGLRRARRRGRTFEVELPAADAVVLDGHPFELALDRARTFGGTLASLRGEVVTLVTSAPLRVGDAYRRHDRVRVAELWRGGYVDALARARALRTRTLAFAALASALFVCALDLYLAL